MRLYEIDNAIMDCVDEETGDIVDIERLNALEMERDAKIESVCLWKKDLEAEAKAIDEEIKKLQARKKADENKVESLKSWVGYALNGVKFKTPKVTVSYRHSTATEFTGDVNSLREGLYKTEKKASLTAIKEALEQGEVIEGARLIEKESVIIK